ncbi:MAG: anhydro-N-acetylmuramic acid kinase [Planctomycetota bacterium]
MSSSRLAVGCMTGTSLDAIDVAVVRIDGHGLDLRARVDRTIGGSLDDIRDDLRAACTAEERDAEFFARLARNLSILHIHAIEEALSARTPDLIAVHGQTIVHAPPLSTQLINAPMIAQRFDCPVVSDLRAADLAAGGDGAPITPLADWMLFRSPVHRRAVLNLGGFANLTVLPIDDGSHPVDCIAGNDVCVCNQLLNAIVQPALRVPYDAGGRIAMDGEIDENAATELADHLRWRREAKRSLGTGDEAFAWLDMVRADLSVDDLAATAACAIGTIIGEAIANSRVTELLIAGGGANHGPLVRHIEAHAGLNAQPTTDHGVPVDDRESIAFAVLGALCADGIPITLPQITGCDDPPPLSGVWTNVMRARETAD